MALLSVNAAENGAGHEGHAGADLRAALDRLPEGRPVTILIHGYRFCPHDPDRDPHRHILSRNPRRDCWKAISWPRHLHLDRPGGGLGIGYGWTATGTLPAAATRAGTVGTQLARMIHRIAEARPDAPIRIVAHSLGARVALGALAGAPLGAVRRMVLMSGAEYRAVARIAATAAPAHGCEILNVTSRENALFDFLFRIAVDGRARGDRTLSAGLGNARGWTDLRIDDPATLAILARLGHRLRPPRTRVCHWSGYLRPGLFGVYRRFLDEDPPDFPDLVRAALAPRDGEACGIIPRIPPLPASCIPRAGLAAWKETSGGNPFGPRPSSGF